MPSYTVKLPNGESYTVSGDNDDEVLAQVSALSGESQTAPQAAQRGAPTSADARKRAADLAIGALPTIGALGAAAMTGGASIPVTALAAGVGGFAGKGVEMGLRTGTGIGAENVPKTMGGRLAAGGLEGLTQASFEGASAILAKSAVAAVIGTVNKAQRSTLGRALVEEKAISADRLRALEANDYKVENIEKQLARAQADLEQSVGRARADAQAKVDALMQRKVYVQQEAREHAARLARVEAAQQSVDEALASIGAGVPGAGQTVKAHGEQMSGILAKFDKDADDYLRGGYAGLEQGAISRGAPPVDVRPLFAPTIARIEKMQKMTGTGGQFTETNEVLARLKSDFEKFGKGKPAVVERAPVDPAVGVPLGPKEYRVKEAIDAVDQNQSLGGLLQMRAGLSQEIGKLSSSEKTKAAAEILKPLLKDTDALIESTMAKMDWSEGIATFRTLKSDWASRAQFREHQAYQLLKKAPERAHELIDAKGGYLPDLKKVLHDSGAYETVWPEIRRQWIESKFTKDGQLDVRGFLNGMRENEGILGEVFDTPGAKAQLRRLRMGAADLDALTNGVTKNAAEHAKQQAFKEQLQVIGEEIAATEAATDRAVNDLWNAGVRRVEDIGGRLGHVSGYERAQIESRFRKRLADAKLWSGGAANLFGPVPSMLMSRGAAGAIMGAGGALAAGRSPLQAAMSGAVGLGAGIALTAGQTALTKTLIQHSEDPVRWAMIQKAMHQLAEDVSPRAAQYLRTALLGRRATRVAQELMPAHEQK